MENAESAWLRQREHDPLAIAPTSQIARDYALIDRLFDDMPEAAVPDSWHDDVLRAARQRRRKRWFGAGALAMAAGAAAVVALIVVRPAPELGVEIHRRDGAVRGDDAAVGDRLRITAHPDGEAELRVYAPGLVARCPGGPHCASGGEGVFELDVPLEAPLPYRVLLVVGPVDAPLDGSMDDYLAAARAAHARVVVGPVIRVH